MSLATRISLIGLLCIALSVITWTLDLAGLSNICIYCRTERSIIGIMGLILLLPPLPQNISRYLGLAFGLFGCHVTNAHLFLHIKVWHSGQSASFISFTLASIALLIIMLQIILIYKYRSSETNNTNDQLHNKLD